ncbi:MAG TPA: SRPBCC domain-containing protein [Polyangiaceae bacterium]|jgi:hypothetical protein
MQLRTEIVIDAPPAEVWRVLTDFRAYHEWNPFITSIAGELRVGARLNVVMSPPEGAERRFRPEIVGYEEQRELRWRGHLWLDALFRGEHFFLLSRADGDGTRLVHGEDFSGLLVKLMGRSLTQAARGFVYMNRALKRRVEKNGRLTEVG